MGFEKFDPDLEGLKSTGNKKDELKRWLLIPKGHLDEEEAEQLWNDDKIITLHYTDRRELVWFLRTLEQQAATPQEIEVYISYAVEDNKIRDSLQKHLSVIEFRGLKIILKDERVEPGQERKRIIEERLKKAEVILLLVSVDYLASIKDNNIKEMTRAVQRHRRGEARVIPIIVRSCGWRYAPFANLEVLPLNKEPIIGRADNIDEVLFEVAEAIKASIEEWVEKH